MVEIGGFMLRVTEHKEFSEKSGRSVSVVITCQSHNRTTSFRRGNDMVWTLVDMDGVYPIDGTDLGHDVQIAIIENLMAAAQILVAMNGSIEKFLPES